MKTDARIQREVLDELKWDTRVDEADVGVEVTQGVVTLTGVVNSFAKKEGAAEAAHRVAGVLDVANDIQVHVPGSLIRTDTDIAQAVRQALEWDALVPEERLQSTVADGWVTLEGSVETWIQREDAARAVRRLTGVRGVTNHISVCGPVADPEQVRAAVEQALARRAEREAHHINVYVHDGTVTLYGPVHSWTEKRAVVGAAGHAPGVRHIEDNLRIATEV